MLFLTSYSLKITSLISFSSIWNATQYFYLKNNKQEVLYCYKQTKPLKPCGLWWFWNKYES